MRERSQHVKRVVARLEGDGRGEKNLHRKTDEPGKVPLEIIKVQSGSYLGEDDIVRLEDTCGRVR